MNAARRKFPLVPADAYQLVDAYIWAASLTRRDHLPGDPVGPANLALGVLDRKRAGDHPDRHIVLVQAQLVAPFNENRATAELTCTTAGVFEIPDESLVDLDAFTVREAVILIYPYLRSHVGQLWRAAAIPIHPLPTLDVVATLAALDQGVAEVKRARRAARPPAAKDSEGARGRRGRSVTAKKPAARR
jgi:preprotein translocase subunit SecB